MDYTKILDQLATRQLEEYQVEPQKAYEFQAALRNYGKRQDITGVAQRGGTIIYHANRSET